MSEPTLHRVVLNKASSLGPCTRLLVEHGYSPWSFWEDLEELGDGRGPHIIVQFHANRDVDLDFLRPLILPP